MIRTGVLAVTFMLCLQLCADAGNASRLAATGDASSAMFDAVFLIPSPGQFTCQIVTSKGSVTIQNGANGYTDVLVGNQLVMVVPPPTSVSQTANLTKDQIKALKATAVFIYSVKATGVESKFNCLLNRPDGSVTTGKVTQVNGLPTVDDWKVIDSNKKPSSVWSQKPDKISYKDVFEGFKIGGSLTSNVGTGTMKSALVSYKCTIQRDPILNLCTFTSVAPGNDGSSAVYTFQASSIAGFITTLKLTKADGTSIFVKRVINYEKGTITISHGGPGISPDDITTVIPVSPPTPFLSSGARLDFALPNTD